nr:zinc finger, CCHC-type [Tanacetum cinerariifolium]
MNQKDLVHGVPANKHTTQICDVCLVRKQNRAPFPKKAKGRSTSPLDLIYGDLCGPITPPTPSGKRYIFLLVDDYSRYMWAYFLSTKDQASDTFKEFKKTIENELRTTLKMFRTDRGGEFNSSESTQYCKENGIARQLTAPYLPQKNRVVERRNRTIMSITRCMMKATEILQDFWDEAVRHAIYILNSVPTKALEDITPYEAIKGKKPNLKDLRVFGCIAYAKELLLAEDEPKNYKEASNDQKWIEAMKDELDSINRNNTWRLTSLPPGHKAIGLKWPLSPHPSCRKNPPSSFSREITAATVVFPGLKVERESFHKRRKLQSDLESMSDEILVSLQTNDNNQQTCKQPFYDARDCLLQLKKSVASLHQKDLLPYNPEIKKISGTVRQTTIPRTANACLPVPPLRQANPPEVIATHQAWVKAQKEIDGLMLMTMDLEIQMTLENLGAYDMLQELKKLYVQQADQELLQTAIPRDEIYEIVVSSSDTNECSIGEYMSQEFLDHLKDHGIITHRTPPYTPQRNGVSKRRNRTLLDMVDKTPYEVWHGQAPKLSYLKSEETMGFSFYYPPENKVFVAWNAEFLKNSLINHEASGSINDLEIIQDEDTHPSLDTSLNHEEHDQEINEPHSDTKPICRPANNKATLLDPESDKWLNSINVEMQSMKDNKVWELVVLSSNGKVIGHTWLFKKKTDMNGAVHTYKARPVAKGFTQTSRINYKETYSPVADIRAIIILISITAFYDLRFGKWIQKITSRFQQNPGDAYWNAIKNILKYLRNTKDMFLIYEGDMK